MTGNTSQNNALEGRDAKTGRFIAGNNGGGRKLGSRNKLTTEFLDDLYAKWSQSGQAGVHASRLRNIHEAAVSVTTLIMASGQSSGNSVSKAAPSR